MIELSRPAAVDEWEQGRVADIRAEDERRRHEHRLEGAATVSRMVDRSETLTAIADLAGVKLCEVRAVVKSVSAPAAASPDALGAPSGATGAAHAL